jgi:hypothetical protein
MESATSVTQVSQPAVSPASSRPARVLSTRGFFRIDFATKKVNINHMSTRDALIHDLQTQPESVLKEVGDFLHVLTSTANTPQIVRDRDSLGYPEGFFERTAGAFAGEAFERPPQSAQMPAKNLED